MQTFAKTSDSDRRPAASLPGNAVADDEFDTTALTPRQIEILEVARHVLAEGGYPAFTMRRIAHATGLHLKSVQYHFKTKRELLRAMIFYVFRHDTVDAYSGVFERQTAETPREKMCAAIRFLLRDIVDKPSTSQYYYELYAMSMRDPDVERLVNIMQSHYRARFQQLIMKTNTTLDAEAAANRAALIASITEGIVLFLGKGKPRHDDPDSLLREAEARILDIVMAP